MLAALMAGVLAPAASCRSRHVLRPFTTDGCSAFPDGTASRPDAWRGACIIHDVAYWRGGTSRDRLAADRTLRDSVALLGYPRTAQWMFYGTRLGGHPAWPTPWRWGYGWGWGRGYRPLTGEEEAQAAVLGAGIPGGGPPWTRTRPSSP